MKKLFCIFVLLICVLCLSGCESSEKDREKLFSALKKEKIISDSMDQIDFETYNVWSLEWCRKRKLYIYKDKNSKMIAIEYENKQHLKDYDYDHLITVYYDVTFYDGVSALNPDDLSCDEEGYYYYQNGEYTDKARYELGISKQYYATEKSSLFRGKYYSLELAD